MSERGPEYFEPEIFAARAREYLSGVPDMPGGPSSGDHDIARMQVDAETLSKARPAAVLIPVIARPGAATVLFTQRAPGLKDHSGQISFPGGKIEPSDEGPLKAALREAFEEIGLPRQAVQPLGFMPNYFSATGFRITPLVALVEPDMPLQLHSGEVSEAFEVPLHFLMSPRNHQVESLEYKGAMRKFYAINYEERYIWGVTAGIIRLLYERLYA